MWALKNIVDTVLNLIPVWYKCIYLLNILNVYMYMQPCFQAVAQQPFKLLWHE